MKIVDQLGNDISDKLATEGNDLHGIYQLALARCLAARYRAYAHLLDENQVFFINIMTAHKEARGRKAKEINAFEYVLEPKADIPLRLSYSRDIRARRIMLKPLPRGTHRFSDKARELQYVITSASRIFVHQTAV